MTQVKLRAGRGVAESIPCAWGPRVIFLEFMCFGHHQEWGNSVLDQHGCETEHVLGGCQEVWDNFMCLGDPEWLRGSVCLGVLARLATAPVVFWQPPGGFRVACQLAQFRRGTFWAAQEFRSSSEMLGQVHGSNAMRWPGGEQKEGGLATSGIGCLREKGGWLVGWLGVSIPAVVRFVVGLLVHCRCDHDALLGGVVGVVGLRRVWDMIVLPSRCGCKASSRDMEVARSSSMPFWIDHTTSLATSCEGAGGISIATSSHGRRQAELARFRTQKLAPVVWRVRFLADEVHSVEKWTSHCWLKKRITSV